NLVPQAMRDSRGVMGHTPLALGFGPRATGHTAGGILATPAGPFPVPRCFPAETSARGLDPARDFPGGPRRVTEEVEIHVHEGEAKAVQPAPAHEAVDGPENRGDQGVGQAVAELGG